MCSLILIYIVIFCMKEKINTIFIAYHIEAFPHSCPLLTLEEIEAFKQHKKHI